MARRPPFPVVPRPTWHGSGTAQGRKRSPSIYGVATCTPSSPPFGVHARTFPHAQRIQTVLPQPTTLPSSHPVRRRPTHRGAGVVHGVQVERATVRTTWTPWAASARLCLGRWWTGWEPPSHATMGPQSATAPPPSRCRLIPAGGTALPLCRFVGCSPHGLGPIHVWAGVGAAGAERAEGRSGSPERSREARPAERSAAGCLDEVEKPVTAQAVGET